MFSILQIIAELALFCKLPIDLYMELPMQMKTVDILRRSLLWELLISLFLQSWRE